MRSAGRPGAPASPRSPGGVDKVEPADEVRHAQRDVVLDAAQQQQRLRLAIFGREADAGGDGVGGAAQPDRAPRRRTPCRGCAAPGRRSPQPIPTVPRRSGPPAPPPRRRESSRLDVPHARVVRPRTYENHRPGLRRAADRTASVIGRPTISCTISASVTRSVARSATSRRRAEPPCGPRAPISAHAVRDVDDRDAIAAQLPHDAEQALRLVLGERGRRLVERQQAYARAQRPHDLHQLALRRAEIARAGPGRRVVLQAEGGEHRAGSPREIGAIEEDAADAAEVAEKQILGDRQVGMMSGSW